MAIQIAGEGFRTPKAQDPLVAVCLFQAELKKNEVVATLDPTPRTLLMEAAQSERFTGKSGEVLQVHVPAGKSSQRLVLIGMGLEKKLSSGVLTRVGGVLARVCRKAGVKSALVALPETMDADRDFGLFAQGIHLGSYSFTPYLSDKGPALPLKKVSLMTYPKVALPKRAKAEIGRALIVAESVAIARDLVNEPGGSLFPVSFANRAKSVAKQTGLTAKVFNPAQLKTMKMGMLLGVGQGSDNPPRLVHLCYKPANSKGKPIVLVGKGVTFDAGGLDLKSPPNMEDMKMDMAGAAAVLGAMHGIAKLKPKAEIHGLLGLAENMPSGKAIRPGDVLVSAQGRTVEINNTDAEGRLVLGDAINYALGLKPAKIIDLATLTGACMVALGPYTVGMFSNRDALAEDIRAASSRAGEDFWRLPLTEALNEQLKSDIADTKNTGQRFGGAITAALFLQGFVKNTPWAHLDIAGPALSSKEDGAIGKGGTGVAVATLLELLAR